MFINFFPQCMEWASVLWIFLINGRTVKDNQPPNTNYWNILWSFTCSYTCIMPCDLWYIAFYWAGFTVTRREMAQEDLKIPYKGAPPHPAPIRVQKTATAPESPYSFRIVRGFFCAPQNYQNFNELWDKTVNKTEFQDGVLPLIWMP